VWLWSGKLGCFCGGLEELELGLITDMTVDNHCFSDKVHRPDAGYTLKWIATVKHGQNTKDSTSYTGAGKAMLSVAGLVTGCSLPPGGPSIVRLAHWTSCGRRTLWALENDRPESTTNSRTPVVSSALAHNLRCAQSVLLPRTVIGGPLWPHLPPGVFRPAKSTFTLAARSFA
jgi:hypothetical protein